MTCTPVRPAVAGLDGLLDAGLRALDISLVEHDQVVSRYADLGVEFDAQWAATGGSNVVSPQGSFLLGTVIRNVQCDDDIDIDIVALRDVDKASMSRAELKADVGVVAQTFAARPHSGRPRVSQSARCWTLTWPGMHLDILPAVPDREAGETNILITDREVRRWLPSNPAGYANWFWDRMREEFLTERAVLAKRLEVEDVPTWQVKTTLQRAVQALKRHRDVFFAGRLDDRPASIIITTLASMSYTGRGDLYDVLREITASMGNHLTRVDGHWVLPNPSQQGENFADSWADDPRRANRFFEWLENAQTTFAQFGQSRGLDQRVPLLGKAFGDRFAHAAARAVGESLSGRMPAGGLRVGAGGALVTGPSGRSVRSHGFAGGSTR